MMSQNLKCKGIQSTQWWCSLGVPTISLEQAQGKTRSGFLIAPDNHYSPYKYDLKSYNLKKKKKKLDLLALPAKKGTGITPINGQESKWV